jgi:LacI family transcriptional regulator
MQQMDDRTRVTVYDIAQAAGTSPSTVSRVLNGSALIADETRTAVLDAADRLGYTRRAVRRPAGRSVLNIVVFLPRAAEPHAHLFYDAAALFAGIQDGFGAVRAHTIVALNGSHSPFEGKKLGDIDGCVFAFSSPSAEIRRVLADREIPAVVINRIDEELACVANDCGEGMAAIARAIRVRRPAARPIYVGVATANPVGRSRWEALAAGGILRVGARDRIEFDEVAAITPRAVSRLVDRGYETFVCANDLVAVAVHDRLRDLGLSVPGDVGLTGYDAAPVRGLVGCPITTVDLAVERMGRAASARLVAAVLERTAPSGCELIPGELIEGASL